MTARLSGFPLKHLVRSLPTGKVGPVLDYEGENVVVLFDGDRTPARVLVCNLEYVGPPAAVTPAATAVPTCRLTDGQARDLARALALRAIERKSCAVCGVAFITTDAERVAVKLVRVHFDEPPSETYAVEVEALVHGGCA